MKNTEGRRQKAEGGVTERAPARTFQDLIVWQKSHSLVLKIYKHSKSFPNNEIFGLTQQLRRSAVSVPANVAESFKKRGKNDKARFFNIAQGSLEETRASRLFFCLLPSAFCLLPSAFCLLPSAF